MSNEIVNGIDYNSVRVLELSDFDSSKKTNYSEEKGSQRIVSLDFQRGLAIWLVTFLHSFESLYDYTWVKEDPKALTSLPIPVLIIGAFVGFFSCWNAYFLLISSTVNSYSTTKKYSEKIIRANKILAKQLLTGFLLIIVGMFTVSFGLKGYLDQGFRYGTWANFDILYRSQFRMSTLHIIGYSLIINGLIHYLLMKKDGENKYLRNMLVYGILTLAIIVASPFVHSAVDNMSWKIPENPPPGLSDSTSWPNEYFQGYNASAKAFFMTIIAGDMEPLFPYLATSFIGSMIGLTLAKKEPVKRLPLIGGLIAIVFMVLGGMFMALGFFVPTNGRPAIGNYLLMLGGQIGVMMLFLYFVEYRGRTEKFANRKIVRHFRMWSMISLTIFSFGMLEIIPKEILSIVISYLFFPVNLLEYSVFGYGKEYIVILVAIYVIFFFEILVSLWSRINFKYSIEWFIILFTTFSTKTITKRLDVKYMLKNQSFVNYKYKLKANIISKTIDQKNRKSFSKQKMQEKL